MASDGAVQTGIVLNLHVDPAGPSQKPQNQSKKQHSNGAKSPVAKFRLGSAILVHQGIAAGPRRSRWRYPHPRDRRGHSCAPGYRCGATTVSWVGIAPSRRISPPSGQRERATMVVGCAYLFLHVLPWAGISI